MDANPNISVKKETLSHTISVQYATQTWTTVLHANAKPESLSLNVHATRIVASSS